MTLCCLSYTAFHLNTLQTAMSQVIQRALERSVLIHRGIDRKQKNPKLITKKIHKAKMILVHLDFNQS